MRKILSAIGLSVWIETVLILVIGSELYMLEAVQYLVGALATGIILKIMLLGKGSVNTLYAGLCSFAIVAGLWLKDPFILSLALMLLIAISQTRNNWCIENGYNEYFVNMAKTVTMISIWIGAITSTLILYFIGLEDSFLVFTGLVCLYLITILVFTNEDTLQYKL